MQRISSVYAKPGMILEYPVYDSWGDIILRTGTKLTAKEIALINDIGVSEIYIYSDYTEDIFLKPMISPELSGALSKSLRKIIIDLRQIVTDRTQNRNTTVNTDNIQELIEQAIYELDSVTTGDISINGCFSIRDYNYVHPIKVAAVAILIGKKAGMTQDELKHIGMASILQNIGYILIPQLILDKPGPLTETEIEVIKNHVIYGVEILQRYTDIESNVITIVYQHHERWNGSGYPNKISKENICKPAQIIGIVDTCFALASKRPHREEFLPVFAMEHSIASPKDATEFILAYSGELFNPELVRCFISQIPLYPAGIKIKLNNNKNGIIIKSNSTNWHRPLIRIFKNNNTNFIREKFNTNELNSEFYEDIDLSEKKFKKMFITETVDY